MAAALLLVQHVDVGLEVGVRGDRAGLAEHLAPLDLLLLGAPQQGADVVAGPALVEELAEHLDPGDRGLLGVAQADDLDLLAHLDDALLHLAGHHGATAGDGHDVLDGHEEGLVDVALGLGDVAVDRVHELEDLGRPLGVALEGLERADPDDRGVVAGELVLVEQLADLELDQVEQLLVVDHVGLVQGDHDVGHAHLAGQQHVLTGLGHRAVGGRDHQDGPVHLGGAGDHVLDVVGVARHVDVGVVPVVGLVLDVGDRDRDPALLLLGRLVDLVERGERDVGVLLGQDLGDGRRERGLAVVDVPHRPDVDVGLRALELLLGHLPDYSLISGGTPSGPPRRSPAASTCCAALVTQDSAR